MKVQVTQKAYALLTAVWMSAILGSLGMAALSAYLGNTRAAHYDLQRIHADLLLNAGLRFAALSIASPRSEVVADAIPASRLIYSNPVADVRIDISNEAGLIDLITADSKLIESLLSAAGLSSQESRIIEQRLSNWKLAGGPFTYRQAQQLLADTPGLFTRLMKTSSLHNSKRGVHPLLASEQVLKLLPDLSHGDRARLIKTRSENSPSLFKPVIESEFFSRHVSPYYRVQTLVSFADQKHSRLQIIKMTNKPGQLFELVATL